MNDRLTGPPYPPYEIEVVNNWLNVNGNVLPPRTNPEVIRTVLIIGRTAILDSINAFYKRTVKENPTAKRVVPPSINVTQLGARSKMNRILSDEGMQNTTRVHDYIEELNEKYHPYWQAVADSDFVPEVRSAYKGRGVGGAWLLLRAPVDETTTFAHQGVEIPGKLEAAFYMCLDYFYRQVEYPVTTTFAKEVQDCKYTVQLVAHFIVFVERLQREYGLKFDEDAKEYLIRRGLLEESGEPE